MKKIKQIKRNIKFAWQRLTRDYDDSISWDLGFESIKHMRNGLKLYLRDAPKVVDLEYHKIEYLGHEFSLLTWLKVFLDICNDLVDSYYDFDDQKCITLLEQYMICYKKLMFYLWW